MASLLHTRNRYTGKQQWLWALAGFVIVILIWWALAESMAIKRPLVDYNTEIPPQSEQNDENFAINIDSIFLADSIKLANATEFEKVYPLLPTPVQVLNAFFEMTGVSTEETKWTRNPLRIFLIVPRAFKEVFGNEEVREELEGDQYLFLETWVSIWRNLQGYFWAIFFAIIIGFPIGLSPPIRALFSKQIDALRYLPLTALTGLFILWLGVGDSMKIAFLAFGILVYLLPVVVQRINEVEEVYLKTVFTLSATDWQMIKSVYLPSVLSKLMDDIRVLTAISWTYIIIAELLNREGGVGANIWLDSKYGRVDKVFVWLFVIIFVGFVQDRLFVYLDKRLFPHKYYKTVFSGLKEVKIGFLVVLGSVMLCLLLSALLPSISGILFNLMYITVITGLIMIIYGEFRFQRSYTL